MFGWSPWVPEVSFFTRSGSMGICADPVVAMRHSNTAAKNIKISSKSK